MILSLRPEWKTADPKTYFERFIDKGSQLKRDLRPIIRDNCLSWLRDHFDVQLFREPWTGFWPIRAFYEVVYEELKKERTEYHHETRT